ncbi:hypothetical protein WDU94_005818 [Cyamophila willieti]
MPRPNAFENKFVCYMCNYSTYKMRNLRAHVCKHSGEKPYKCGYCSFGSGRKFCITKHMKTQHRLYNFLGYVYDCQHCKLYKTTSLKDILAHCKACEYMPRPNAFESKYVCYMCNYATYKMELIRAHVCSHSGEKPYKCRYCSFASRRQSYITNHLKIKHKNIKF